MTALFVPPSKTPAAPGPIIPDNLGSLDPLVPTDLDPPAAAGAISPVTAKVVPPAASLVMAEPAGLNELAGGDAGGSVDGATGLDSEAAAPPVETAMALRDRSLTSATVDNVFFYGYSAAGSVLYQVNLNEGSLIAVSEPVTLFSTALNGLFTSEPGGLGGTGEASTEPPLSSFYLVEGTIDKNFLIGTTADNALFGFGGGDLILTTSGYNLAFSGEGNDTLVGGASDNGLFGGAGDDAIEGGAGDDLLVGGAGSDILYGGGGANTLVGGAGADVFRLNSPGAYDPLVGGSTDTDTILDFNVAEGDLLDFSMIAAQPLFAGGDLLPFVSVVQVGADTHVQITTPLGQVSTEAILVGVEADTITPASFTFTPPIGAPLLK